MLLSAWLSEVPRHEPIGPDGPIDITEDGAAGIDTADGAVGIDTADGVAVDTAEDVAVDTAEGVAGVTTGVATVVQLLSLTSKLC